MGRRGRIRILRLFTILMIPLFLVSAAVQYNDPDPIRWIAIYGLAALASVLALRKRTLCWIPAIIGVIALIWAATLLPEVLGQVAPGDLFREMGMASLKIEEAREMVGLLIVAGWMVVLFLTSFYHDSTELAEVRLHRLN